MARSPKFVHQFSRGLFMEHFVGGRAYYSAVQSSNLILLIRLKWFVLLVTIVN